MDEINITISEEDKEQMEEICHSLNISVEDSLRLFCKHVINNKALPFEITEDLNEEELNDRDDIWL